MDDSYFDYTIIEKYNDRIRQPLHMFGHTYDGATWWWILGPLLALAAIFVIWMYVKDSRTIRWYFAVPLAMMRATVYGLLAYMFLLPTVKETKIRHPRIAAMLEKRSKVVVLIDVSDSQAQVSIDPKKPVASGGTSRLQKVVEYISDDRAAFLSKLIEKNPVFVYRFASRLDAEVYSFKQSPAKDGSGRKEITPYIMRRKKDKQDVEEPVEFAPWTDQDWRNFATYTDFKSWVVRGLSDEGRAKVQQAIGPDKGDVEWATDYIAQKDDAAVDPLKLSDEDARVLKGNRYSMQGRINLARTITQGTNLHGSVDAAFETEKDNMLQGIIVFSDGRSNIGVDSRRNPDEKEEHRKLNPALEQLHRKAKSAGIPIFTVAVGDDRLSKRKLVRITDVQAPSQSPPDDAFKIIVEVDGENMPRETVLVQLELYPPGEDSDTPAVIEGQVTFDGGEGAPPHGQFEWTIDPAKLPEKVPEDLKPRFFVNNTFVEGIWKVKVTTPKVSDDGKPDPKERVSSEPAKIVITRKKVSVLLICGAPNRDFQFLLNQLLRETTAGKDIAVGIDKENVSVYVQNEAGTFQDGKSITFLENKYRQLRQFPNTLHVEDVPSESEEQKWLNLARYDVIIAFDPDWTLLTEEQAKLLQTWVDLQAGGLLQIAGPVNTKKLTYPENATKLGPLLDILPVVPGDYDLKMSARLRNIPRRLEFPGAAPEMEFLRLDDEKQDDLLAGWEPFFTGKATRDEGARLEAKRGFYDYYPIKDVKAGATVVARYLEPNASDNTFDKKDPPYIVTYKYGQGWTAFLGSSEVWRFRQFKDVFFERFWVKMSRFLASGSSKKQNKRGRILMAKEYMQGDYLRVTSHLLDASLQPLPDTATPEIIIRPYKLDPESLAAVLGAAKKDGAAPPPRKDDVGDPDRLTREEEEAYKKLTKRFTMKARKSSEQSGAGYFELKSLLASKEFPSGQWRVEVPVPNSSESLTERFVVRKALPPELADVRPDYASLAAISVEVDDPLLKGRFRNNLDRLEELRRHAYSTPEVKNPRLMFKFDDKPGIEMIPECTITDIIKIKNPEIEPEVRKEKIEPRWFEGPEVPRWMTRWYDKWQGQSERSYSIALWMLVCIALLSTEWLTRKLLKLA
jgi:hypothetical protein